MKTVKPTPEENLQPKVRNGASLYPPDSIQMQTSSSVSTSPMKAQPVGSFQTTPRKGGLSATHQPVVQRVLEINGNKYSTKRELAISKGDAFSQYQKCADANKEKYLTDENKAYRLAPDGSITPLDEEVGAQADPYAEKMATHVRSAALSTMSRAQDYPLGQALYAPIGHAIVVKGQGKYKFIGTDGLNGCVEVMMECKSDDGNVYLVAHVSSLINSKPDEILSQLQVMLKAVNAYLKDEITWADFGLKPDSKGKLRLVRSSGGVGDQLLYHTMMHTLLDLGASLREHVSNSVTMDISVPEARYFDNDVIKPKPSNIDQRRLPGYPYPEVD